MLSLAALFLSACGAASPMVEASPVEVTQAKRGGGCAITEEAPGLYRADGCGPTPRWVAIDLDVQALFMETMQYPNGRRADCSDPASCNVGRYMTPVRFEEWLPSEVGRAYGIQVRDPENGANRATMYLTFNRDGSVTVAK